MGTISNKEPEQPLNNDENNKDAETNATPNSELAVKIKNLTINVFFDGTGNNMFNTDLRLKENPTEQEKKLQDKLEDATSYGNYYTNVALLYMASTKVDDVVENIYVQGSGTVKYEKDQVSGLGFAQGESGVETRVTWTFNEIKKLVGISNASRITLNVFGFSRGAFYARYFCAMAKVTEEEIKKENDKIYSDVSSPYAGTRIKFYPIDASGRKNLSLKNENIRINLVGIYDTVSSHGLDHYDDVKPFHLDIGKKQGIARVVHLVAQNDYRRHFPLTHIDTAMGDGIGFECSFPGAHSDIGGSYNKDYEQTQYISLLSDTFSTSDEVKGEITWKWFKEKGYYQGDPTSYDKKLWGDFVVEGKEGSMLGSPTTRKVYVNYKVPNNNYQFILANVMKKVAEDQGAMTFLGDRKIELDKSIASIGEHFMLMEINYYACNYVLKNYKYSSPNTFHISLSDHMQLSAEDQQRLFHEYIHNSLDPMNQITRANIGNIFYQGNPPKRAMINDNE